MHNWGSFDTAAQPAIAIDLFVIKLFGKDADQKQLNFKKGLYQQEILHRDEMWHLPAEALPLE